MTLIQGKKNNFVMDKKYTIITINFVNASRTDLKNNCYL